MRSLRKNGIFWIVALVGLILDQLTKYIVVQTFAEIGHTIPIWEEVFHLTYVINTGAAFSFFQGGVGWLRWLSLLVSLALICMAWWGPKLSEAEQMAYGCILAGALGNGVDRFLFGYVVDFLDFRWINFPVFNLADVLINIGILILLYASWQQYQSPGK